MEYEYYSEWDKRKDKPRKVYTFNKNPFDPDPEELYDTRLKKKVKVKRYYGKAPMGFVH